MISYYTKELWINICMDKDGPRNAFKLHLKFSAKFVFCMASRTSGESGLKTNQSHRTYSKSKPHKRNCQTKRQIKNFPSMMWGKNVEKNLRNCNAKSNCNNFHVIICQRQFIRFHFSLPNMPQWGYASGHSIKKLTKKKTF